MNKEKDSFFNFIRRNKSTDENDKWIQLWFTGSMSHHNYLPPLPVLFSMLLLIITFTLNQLDIFIRKPIGIFSCVTLIVTFFNILLIIAKINIEELIISFTAFLSTILGIITLQHIPQITILLNFISILIVILIQLYVRYKKKKNLYLKIIHIESVDYEREVVFFIEKSTGDIFFTEWDLGDKLQIGLEYRINTLWGNQYHREKIIFNNKSCIAFHITNINKDTFFKNTKI